MQCQRCGSRPAAYHQTVIVNGQKQESHLCENCATQGGATGLPNLSIQQLLASFLGQGANPFAGGGTPVRQAEPTCSHCGMTYSQFAETGRLGCARCYDELGPHLAPLIKRIHGAETHQGKAPKRTGGLVRMQRELSGARVALQQAISAEKFEEAARLRDRIKELETQLQAGGK
ncbi:MAG TPA: UvrB/UvrC motif-containing protein [Symbiobacteriaceae bacterium]|nr:UvrB/UvrC motif-containing protein [Symbiobacteriaceae bacterium]